MTATPANASLVDRMVRAARVDEHLYEEVEADRTATGQAATVVVISSLATGIGLFLAGATDDGIGAALVGLVVGVIAALVSWAIFAWLTYWIGSSLLATEATHADWGEVARALGFAQAPYVLLVFGFLPVLGALIAIVVGLWVLWATIVAIRQALDFSTLRAAGTAVLGWLVLVVVRAVIFAVTGV